MGPGATKVNFFEAPSIGDAAHHVLAVGPLQIGIACQGEPTGTGEIKLFTFITIPGPTTLLSSIPTPPSEPEYTLITGSVTDLPGESVVAAGKKMGFYGGFVVAGADGVPYWLTINYGANTEAKSSAGPPVSSSAPRGCWFLAEEV
jgi:hypothetical protein